MKKVDLNVDIGEGLPNDEALLEFATSANVCCGEHAGNWELSTRTVDLCRRKGVRVGCHPGFPDRDHCGRRLPAPEEVDSYLANVKCQVDRFAEACEPAYIKPHGALYNILSARGVPNKFDPYVYAACSGALINMLLVHGLPPMLPLGSRDAEEIDQRIAPVWNTKTIYEGFADRRYLADGSLMPRSEPGAVLEDPDEVKNQVLRLAPQVDTICLHGDTPGCLELAELVKKALVDAGYEVGY